MVLLKKLWFYGKKLWNYGEINYDTMGKKTMILWNKL